MEENKTKEPGKLIWLGEIDLNKKLKSIIKSFVVLESHINEKIVANNLKMQNRINNIKQYDIAFKNNNKDVSKENDILTPEMQDIIRQTIVDKLEADKEKEEQSLIEKKDNERAEAIEHCKQAINEDRQQLEDKVKDKKEKIKEIQAKIRENKKDLEEVKNSIATLKLKPESRTFKILEKEQQEIMQQQKSLSREKGIANGNIKSAESELESFDEIYGNINFESENVIHDILKIMYGKEGEKADYSTFLLEDEWEETLDNVQNAKIVEEFSKKLEKAKQEQAKKKEENKREGQESNPNPNPTQKSNPTPTQKPNQNPSPSLTQDSEQQLTPEEREILNVSKYEAEITEKEKSITKMLSRGKNKSRQYPTLTYIAEKDSYIARGKNGEVLAVRRGVYREDVVKKFICREMKINQDELGYIDTSIVSVWMGYDDKYGTDETTKYIQSILNPDMTKESQNSGKITYNMKGLYSNKNISKEDKQKLLEYANYAQEFNVANVKKGFIASITERITNTIKRSNNNKLDKGKSGAEIIAEDLKNREARKRENKFKKEIQVTNTYNDIERQISNSDKDGLDNILENAKEELREGKISTTEYSGLMYNANNRRKELSSAKPAVKKEPVASTPQQESEDRV